MPFLSQDRVRVSTKKWLWWPSGGKTKNYEQGLSPCPTMAAEMGHFSGEDLPINLFDSDLYFSISSLVARRGRKFEWWEVHFRKSCLFSSISFEDEESKNYFQPDPKCVWWSCCAGKLISVYSVFALLANRIQAIRPPPNTIFRSYSHPF